MLAFQIYTFLPDLSEAAVVNSTISCDLDVTRGGVLQGLSQPTFAVPTYRTFTEANYVFPQQTSIRMLLVD